MNEEPDAEILLELNRIGGAIEVRAVSPGDGLEVAFTAPADAAQADIEQLARAKLRYVRTRHAGGQGGASGPPTGGRGGIVV